MASDPKGRTEAGYLRHAFVCGHQRGEGAARPSCMNRGSLDLMRELKQRVREGSDLNLRVQKSGCLDFCEQGPTCVVYPEGAWYSLKDEAALEAVFQHLVSGMMDEQATLKLE